ncbi:hypothetical protein [Streptomyces phaeoluteigriseus]
MIRAAAASPARFAFHRSLGFDTKIVDDYDGPGRAMAVFHRELPLNVPRP